MGGSGLIFAGIAVAWAAFLVPMALRRHDLGDPRQGVSAAVRVLRRRPAADSRGRLDGAHSADPSRRSARRPAASAGGASAAARRRRVLLGLVLLLVATIVLVAVTGVPRAALGVPAVLVVGYLAALLASAPTRVHTAGRPRPDLQPGSRPAAPEPASPWRVPAPVLGTGPTAVVPAAARTEVAGPDGVAAPAATVLDSEPTVVAAPARPAPPAEPFDVDGVPTAPRRHPASELEPVLLAAPGEVAVQSVPADPRAWEPVPVPLPTYVTAPKATRTIRTIDLSAPGAWTSGRLSADPPPLDGADGTPPVAAPMSEPDLEQRPAAVGD